LDFVEQTEEGSRYVLLYVLFLCDWGSWSLILE
jgi:hypothetical protein